MAGLLDAIESEFVVRRARLARVTPFPSWNGVVASSSDGVVSVLAETGSVYLLRLTESSSAFEIEESLVVSQVLENERGDVMSMCQAWLPRGRVFLVARDCQLAIYTRSDDDKLVATSTTTLRFAASSIDVLEHSPEALLIAIGCVAGLVVYSVGNDGTSCQLVGSLMGDIAVSVVRFSPDGEFLSVGTVDGRVMVLRRDEETFSTLADSTSFSKVLAAPRVTSISFSPSSDKAIITTRKGNVYVLKRKDQIWAVDEKFDALTANPKGGATSQTLSCWWGSELENTTPIFTTGGRSSSMSVEMFDIYSHSLLHTLELSSKNDTSASESVASPSGNDLHLVGIACLPSKEATTPPRLLCLDSDATLSIVEWPFLAYACPR